MHDKASWVPGVDLGHWEDCSCQAWLRALCAAISPLCKFMHVQLAWWPSFVPRAESSFKHGGPAAAANASTALCRPRHVVQATVLVTLSSKQGVLLIVTLTVQRMHASPVLHALCDWTPSSFTSLHQSKPPSSIYCLPHMSILGCDVTAAVRMILASLFSPGQSTPQSPVLHIICQMCCCRQIVPQSRAPRVCWHEHQFAAVPYSPASSERTAIGNCIHLFNQPNTPSIIPGDPGQAATCRSAQAVAATSASLVP